MRNLFLAFLLFPTFIFAQQNNLLDLSLEELLNIKVESASKLSEPIEESPVPVTIITRDMIINSGAKNLKDLLILYVPGFTFSQDHNEVNVAVRGVYASSQQKILIMRDGHRLNCRAYSEANPDFSISLNNIKQIEILRGPSSSLYGNVALTAVINIVTLSSKDINGLQVNCGVGNYGQKTASFIYGNNLENNELLIYGSFYESDGQKYKIAAQNNFSSINRNGYAYLNGFKNRPSYDFGLKYKFGDYIFNFSNRSSTYIEPFSGGGKTGEIYEYDAVKLFDEQGPGLTSTSSHSNLERHFTLTDKLELSINGYYDANKIHGIINGSPLDTSLTGIKWNEYDLGLSTQLGYEYETTLGKANAIFGFQLDYMYLNDAFMVTGKSGKFTNYVNNLMIPGREIIYSTFGQIKQKFFNYFIANLGFRYDYKIRRKGDPVDNLSPRIALIYNPNESFQIKLSYSQSFVDAPYWYRYNSLKSYAGSENLKPEYLKSYQFTNSIGLLNNKLKNNLTIFYNNLTDFVYRNNNATGTLNDPFYVNAGELKNWGIEEEIAYIEENLRIRANATYQKVIDFKFYDVINNNVKNVPSLAANFVIDISPLPSIIKNLWYNLSVRYIGEQESPYNIVFSNGRSFINTNYKVKAATIINTAVRWDNIFNNNLSFKVSVDNLLDEKYEQGGSVIHPYPQPGRWYLIELGYKIF